MKSKFSQFIHNRFRANEIKIHELSYLFWECTWRCNLKCRHCGSDCVSDSKVKDMPFDDFLNAILPLKKIYKPNSITVAITGGEPLLRPDLVECGKTLRKNGFHWGIVTNGYAYNADIHARLLSAGMGSLTLSLDGFEENHNWLRANNNSFKNAVGALELITSSKRLNYDVVTCVNSKNFSELEELKKFLISKNVKAWRLFTIAPIGRAANNLDMQLNNQQTQELMRFITQSRLEDNMNITFSCEAYVGEYEKKVRDSHFFCRAGINIASVLIDGSISACPNIDRSFIQGNIYNDNFVDIWENKFDVMRDRIWTKIGICAKCKDYKNCNGGAMHLWNSNRDGIMTCVNERIKQNL
ncbi:TIGR04133 family radical SAM/SPASM protein [Odoribacter sp. OttesenSCG-928-L07]|nr:TIGR04133 family radical SAM/SPASM protein [Odoribacter sp. OttesenSCG-928-L07]MDL2241025.1 TIGR04133 family radical SAM/SPASM protein [Bacteroidales bacterium OttesenSCG-928-K22]